MTDNAAAIRDRLIEKTHSGRIDRMDLLTLEIAAELVEDEVMTLEEYEALELKAEGYGYRRMSRVTLAGPDAMRRRLLNARNKVDRARRDAAA